MRSILAKYDAGAALDRRIAELDPAATAGGLSPLHVRTVEVLTDLLSMADQVSDESTPQMLRTMLSVVRRSRPMLLELIGKVPEAAIIATMTKLRDDVQSVLDTAPPPAQAVVVEDQADDQVAADVQGDNPESAPGGEADDGSAGAAAADPAG